MTLFALIFVGCDEPQLEVKYGKVHEQPRSINSTSMFANRLEQLGYDVTIRNRISPKINQFDIVFWFPETSGCPSERAIEALEDWLQQGYTSKSLVYVSGDYRADEDYLRAIYGGVDSDQKPELLRRLSEAQLIARNNRSSIELWSTYRESCEWFDVQLIGRKKSNQLSGRLVSEIDSAELPDLEIGNVLVPKKTGAGSGRWEITSLLAVDGEDLAYRMTEGQDYRDAQIIVVNNASFLVNLSMMNPDKEALADALIAEATSPTDLDGFGYQTRVLLLESGPGDIPVRSTDYVNRTQWAWIAERPLCYIVPHAFLWGIIFCFVCFPIFGRPRSLPKKSTTSFRSHVDAIGKQLSRTGSLAHAHQSIKRYQDMVSDTVTKKK
jgi:hypothetical protein